MNVPIPQRKPSEFSRTANTVGDFFGGVFNKGLDFLSNQIDFKNQLELLKHQNQMDQYAAAQSAGQTPSTNSGTGATVSSGVSASPLTIALLGAAAFLLAK